MSQIEIADFAPASVIAGNATITAAKNIAAAAIMLFSLRTFFFMSDYMSLIMFLEQPSEKSAAFVVTAEK
ncbi:MAG: hypothetical protein IKM19_03760, partial [Firmicutes bacterium]|nr:hypothetical protein [Bacillota bacterium]